MLNELAKEVHEIAVEHGWWEDGSNFGMKLALIHSEVTEVLEDFRHGKSMDIIQWEVGPHSGKPKPAGIPIEFADIIIRVLDLCAYHNIDIETAIKEKIAYNRERPYRHGNLKA